MAILNFIINEIFGQGAIFLALVAMVGLILQKKSVSEVVRGTLMTAIGFFVLNTGTGLITGNSIDGIITAFNTLMPGNASAPASIDIGGQYGTQIGIVMILAFAINLLVARFTPWKSVFLTGHIRAKTKGSSTVRGSTIRMRPCALPSKRTAKALRKRCLRRWPSRSRRLRISTVPRNTIRSISSRTRRGTAISRGICSDWPKKGNCNQLE